MALMIAVAALVGGGLRAAGLPNETALFYAVLAPASFAAWMLTARLPGASGAWPWALGVLWVVWVQGDVLLLGAGARPEWGDGNELFWTYFPYLAKSGDAPFLHLLAGGVGRSTVGRMGAELFSWRVWLSGLLPLWLVAVIVRFAVTFIAYAGAYLAARDIGGADRRAAAAIGCVYAVGYDVTATMTFLYGFSLAGLPLIYWALWRLRAEPLPAACVLAGLAVYTTGSDPYYWLPTFWIIGAAIFALARPVDLRMCLGGAVATSAFWLVNFGAVIVETVAYVPQSSRMFTPPQPGFIGSFLHLIDWSFAPAVSYNRGGWPMFSAAIVVAFAALVDRRKMAAAFALLIGLGVFSSIARQMPFDLIGLGFLKTYNWYVEYGAFAFATVATGIAIASAARRLDGAGAACTRVCATALFAVAFGQSLVMRLSTVVDSYYRGGIARASQIPNLAAPDWYAGQEWRAISVGGYPFANTPVNTGIATYDGTATFFPDRLYLYWRDGILRGQARLQTLEVQVPPDWNFWSDGAPRRLAEKADLDLLRAANVRYVLSVSPLADPELRKVSGPQPGIDSGPPTPKSSLDILSAKMRTWLREPPPVHVYELDGAAPRAYAARSVESVPDDLAADIYPRVARTVATRGALIPVSVAAAFKAGDGEIEKLELRPDGYEIRLSTGAGGTVVVNTPYVSNWRAIADGRDLALAPANVAQLAVSVPEGVRRIRLVYARMPAGKR